MVDVWAPLEIDVVPGGAWMSECAEVSITVGGAANVCRGVQKISGWHSKLVSTTGAKLVGDHLVPDELATMAMGQLDSSGIGYSCVPVENTRTARVVALYPPAGGRLMVSDIGRAPDVPGNHVHEAVQRELKRGAECLIFLDGYLYLDPRSEDLRSAVKNLPTEKCITWLDVVPHSIPEVIDLQEFLETISPIDLITIDRLTIDGFARKQPYDIKDAIEGVVEDGMVVAIVDEDKISLMTSTNGETTTRQIPVPKYSNKVPGGSDSVIAELLTTYVDEYMFPTRRPGRHEAVS